LLIIFLAGLAVLYLLHRRRGLVTPAWAALRLTKMDWLLVPSLVLIGWSIYTVSALAYKYPLIEWDAVSTWGYKAKMFSMTALPDLGDYFHDYSLNFSHLDYPLLVPFLTAGEYAALGEVNDTLGKTGILFLFWCYAVFIYAAVRPLLPRCAAGAVTALAVSAPMVLRWAGAGTADMPLAIFYAGSAYYLTRWIVGGTVGDAWLAGFFSAACLFTKNEGLALAVINLFAAAALGWKAIPRPRYVRELGGTALVCLLVLLPWIIFRHALPHIDENYPGHLNPANIAANLARVPYVFNNFYNWTFFDPDSNYFWQLALGALLLGLCTRPSAAAYVLLFLLLAQLAAYLLAYVITPMPLEDLVFVTMKRLLLHALPATIFIFAFSLSKILPNPETPPPPAAG
jgi:4-amino-4-deoxy-L-arabinose transferase-like glycosyltransferase